MAFATDPQVFLFLKKVYNFIISILNREMLLIFGSLFLFIFLDTHFSVCLSRPERVQVFHNVSYKLPFTPSPLKATVEAEQLCEGDSHTTPTQSQLHVLQCIAPSMQRAYGSVWAYQNDYMRTEGGNKKKGARDREREWERGGWGGGGVINGTVEHRSLQLCSLITFGSL